MSKIDCYKHSIIGDFCHYLPIYILHQDCDDFDAKENQILLGGGSGEHPACIIQSLDLCVINFLRYVVDKYTLEVFGQLTNEKYQEIYNVESLIYAEKDLVYSYDILDFQEWHTIHYYNLEKSIEQYKCGDIEEDDYLSSESYIINCIGELVTHSLSHLIQNKKLIEIRNKIKDNLYHIEFSGVTIFPPHYPLYGKNYFRN